MNCNYIFHMETHRMFEWEVAPQFSWFPAFPLMWGLILHPLPVCLKKWLDDTRSHLTHLKHTEVLLSNSSLEDRTWWQIQSRAWKMLSTRISWGGNCETFLQKSWTIRGKILLYPPCRGIHIFNKAGEIDLEGITLFQKLHCQGEPHYLLARCSWKI